MPHQGQRESHLELLPVYTLHVLESHDPVLDRAVVLPRHGSAHGATFVVPTQDDVLHLQTSITESQPLTPIETHVLGFSHRRRYDFPLADIQRHKLFDTIHYAVCE